MAQTISTPRELVAHGDLSGAPRTIVQNKIDGDTEILAASRQKHREGEDVRKRTQQSVIICDRNLLFRAGLVHALDKSHFQVVAECSIIDEVPVASLASHLSIVLLIGLDLAKIGAIQSALLDLRRRVSGLYIIMFYDHDWIGPVPAEMAEIGHLLDAMLPKDSIGSDSVLKALDLVLLGTSVVSKEFFQRVTAEGDYGLAPAEAIAVDPDLASVLPTPQAPTRWAHQHAADSLTVREKLILSHLMRGASNKAIARDVGIAESTVKIHVRNLMLKIDAKNRTQAAMWGYKNLL